VRFAHGYFGSLRVSSTVGASSDKPALPSVAQTSRESHASRAPARHRNHHRDRTATAPTADAVFTSSLHSLPFDRAATRGPGFPVDGDAPEHRFDGLAISKPGSPVGSASGSVASSRRP